MVSHPGCVVLSVASLPMARVLVVDDEAGIRTALAQGLKALGFEVLTAADGPRALRAALTGTFDVIVLDVVLPGLSGLRVLHRLRAYGVDTPVLLISAKDSEVDQAEGLGLGADGYLVKPFSYTVLVAQVRALLRRREDRPDRARPVVRLGGLTVHPAGELAKYAGGCVELTAREFELLYALVSHCDTVLSRDELLQMVWGTTHAGANAVDVYVGYVRRKLQTIGAGHLVRTVRGCGFEMPIPSEMPQNQTVPNPELEVTAPQR
jgi:DNA-binding response OmpR family regulator